MPAHVLSAPQSTTPPRLPALTNGSISSRRRIRMQAMTDLYAALDSFSDPKRPHFHCTAVYELEDRSKPSISSF